jgi:hypothetical protein
MAKATKKGGKGGKGGKQRRWKIVPHSRPPEVILPPQLRTAMGWPVDPRWFAAADQALIQCHERYDAGDKSALLDAVEILSVFFPPWAREAYGSAWAAYRQYAVATLDQAFGVERSGGKHLAKARTREMLRWQIMFRVYCLHRQGAPLDDATFTAVAGELNIGLSTVRRIFSEPESDELRELLRNQPFLNSHKSSDLRGYLSI